MAQTQLANPSFEEDVANVGNPDGWKIGKGAQAKVVSGNASVGNRALLVSDGYVAVYQDLQIAQLAGQNISFRIDAKSVTPNAAIGVRIGYATTDNKWHDSVLLWNKPITAEYQTLTASRTFPENAKPGRLYIGIYRSDKKSTFYIDNIKVSIGGGLSENDAHRAVTLARDAQYFLNRLEATTQPLPQKEQWQQRAQNIINEANAADATLTDKLNSYNSEITSLNTQLFAALANNELILTGFAPAFERLSPDALPPLKSTFNSDILTLRGEHQALAIDIATSQNTDQEITLRVQGLPANCNIIWRRQVMTETWYTKGKTLIADPLTLLKTADKSTFITVQPGELIRLFADIDITGDAPAGKYPVTIELCNENQVIKKLTCNLHILPQVAAPQKMTHYAFGYTNHFPITNHPAEAVRDLTAHGVTDIEWAFMPPATFDAQGNLVKVNFNSYNRLLPYFKDSPIRLNVFWQPAYAKFMTEDGKALKVLSPEWNNALVQIFEAWIKNAQEQGLPADRITVLVKDEIHSAQLENAPDAAITEYVQISQILHDKIPALKNYLTLSYYAFPADVKLALPQMDVVMPHMPVPAKLSRNAPPTYNPRKAFAEEIYPMLFEARKERGLEISSYHVAAGRSDDLLQWNRFYPMLAAATGHTGIAYWAYNGIRGSSWDDTDGGLLDYNFVYRGQEDNPVCEQYNVTGEIIVPSIRWEAVRAGLQDANIILALEKANLNAAQRTKFQAIIAQGQQWKGETDVQKEDITLSKVEDMSRQLRELYTDVN